MQDISLVHGARILDLLFLLNQSQQLMVEINLYLHQKQKDVQTVQDLERLDGHLMKYFEHGIHLQNYFTLLFQIH